MQPAANTSGQSAQSAPGPIEALTRIGVGAAYHSKRFADFEHGEAVLAWFLANREDFFSGRPAMCVGLGPLARSHFVMLARTTFKQNFPTRLLSLIRLADVVTDDDRWESVMKPVALFVDNFQDEQETALTREQTRWVEDLIVSRSDAGKATFMRATLPNTGRMPPLTWWSNELSAFVRDQAILKALGKDAGGAQ